MRALIIVALVASPASAEQLTGRRVDGQTIHIANNQGAINRHGEIRLTIDLADKHRASVVARGTSDEHNLWADGRNTDDKVAWTTTWKGTWSTTAASLTLELALTKHDCKAWREETGRLNEARTCKTASAKAKLVCSSDHVDVDGKQVAAWLCTSDGDLAETGGSWVLGKTQCLETQDGMHPSSYAKCQGPD